MEGKFGVIQGEEDNTAVSVPLDVLTSTSILHHLPPKFTAFLLENGISLSHFDRINEFPRYIRLKPSFISIGGEIDDILKKDLNTTEVQRITYLDSFYSIPADVRIVSSSLYQRGELYGIDLSSGAVVKALDPQPGERILDLCCCPGMKLCYIADLIGPTGSAVGVDINQTRLNTCRSIVKKYNQTRNITLVQADGTTFAETGFDRVLVDAECTHDGSLKHLAKFIENHAKSIGIEVKSSSEKEETVSRSEGENPSEGEEEIQETMKAPHLSDKPQEKKPQVKQQQISKREVKRRLKQLQANNSNTYTSKKIKRNEWTMADFEERVLDQKKLNNIITLQKSLLENGFRACRPGGILLYSTCSFARAQNEDVVEWFMKNHAQEVEQIPVFDEHSEVPCKEGFIPLTIRFDAFVSKSGGMFAAKFKKSYPKKDNREEEDCNMTELSENK